MTSNWWSQLFKRHVHTWVIVSATVIEPLRRGDFDEEKAYGVTITTHRCSGCGDLKNTKLLGQHPNLLKNVLAEELRGAMKNETS